MLFQYCRCVEDTIKHLLVFPLLIALHAPLWGRLRLSAGVSSKRPSVLRGISMQTLSWEVASQRHHGSTQERKNHWVATEYWEQLCNRNSCLIGQFQSPLKSMGILLPTRTGFGFSLKYCQISKASQLQKASSLCFRCYNPRWCLK